MPPETPPSLATELHRLRAWQTLFGAWSALQRSAADAQALAAGACRLLVEQAGYASASADLQLPGGQVLQCQHGAVQAPTDAHHADCAVQSAQGQWGHLRVVALAEDGVRPESQAMVQHLACDLALGLQALGSTAVPLPSAQMEWLGQAIAQSPFGVVVMDVHGGVEYCNASFTAMTGYTLDEIRGLDTHPWNPSQTTAAVYRDLLASQQHGGKWNGDLQSRRKDGSLYWERQVVFTLRDAAGQHTRLVVVKQDISARKTKRDAYERTRRLQEQALVSSSNGIMITRSDADDHSIVYVNPAFERITGYTAEEVIGREGRFLVRDDLAQSALEVVRSALHDKREATATLRNYRKDGSLFWNELHIAPVRDLSGESTTHFVSVINDVSERVQYQQALEYQANHDSLTGLANRNLLNDRIEQAIAWARRNNSIIGVMLLDLDHFKRINDASGHTVGDALLKEVASRLRNCVRDTDTVARLGGDEFVIILTDLPQPDDVDHIATKVLGALARPIEIVGRDVEVTASIGVALYPRDGDHGEVLLRYADIAMYRVKEHGRNSVRSFVPEMGSSAISRLDMEAAMRRGLERGEFLVHYQPKIELASQRIVGAEALVRWQHPQIGLIHPVEFIHLAEETGLIVPLGEWVLEEACRQQAQWREQGLGALKLAVNMSARQFRLDDLSERVAAIVQRTGAEAHNIVLELTESMVMQDVDTTRMSLAALKKLGLSLSLDDFGTGYSSLSYLRRFPIDELKIDRSFVNDIHANDDDAAIAMAIIAMARSLGLAVVAEGVESRAQADLLERMGCTQVQGYLYARPMPPHAFLELVRAQPQGDGA